MKSTVEPLEGNKVKVSVEVDETEFDKEVDAAFKRIAREVRIPGVRPGKAPRRILEARVGTEAARASWSAGLAAENMLLAAWELGIGSCPATVYDQSIAREVLGHPERLWCAYVLSFGFPADPEDLTRPPKAGGRRPIGDVLHRERW